MIKPLRIASCLNILVAVLLVGGCAEGDAAGELVSAKGAAIGEAAW